MALLLLGKTCMTETVASTEKDTRIGGINALMLRFHFDSKQCAKQKKKGLVISGVLVPSGCLFV